MGDLGSLLVRPERPDGRPLVVAHRGASHDRIENTAEAFVEAVLGPEVLIRIELAAYPTTLGTSESMMEWAMSEID